MKISTSISELIIRILFTVLIVIFFIPRSEGQNDTTQSALMPDTGSAALNMDAIYNRPFLNFEKIPVAIGGYAEVNTQYENTDGTSEGMSFQMRRMSLFVSSTIHQKIRFLGEIEFEDGTKEINLETAIIDIEFHTLLNLRAGIILNPIGSFNQNHDGPRWEFVDRPIAATDILPATWSNAGAGLYGKIYSGKWILAYEAYLTNGFDDRIIANENNRTFLGATKENRDRFEESSNGVPLVTAKLAVRQRNIGEIGFSYMGGIYNTFKEDGLITDEKRRVDVFALDLSFMIPGLNTTVTGEAAMINVEVPRSYSQQYGDKQWGGFVDLIQPVLRKSILGFKKSVINAAVRIDYADFNAGTFNETGGNIADDIFAITSAISWRPSGQTVLRFNYKYSWQKDLLGNPASRTSTIQFGISSYF